MTQVDKEIAISKVLPKRGEIKGVTCMELLDNGETLYYGTKVNQIIVTVKGLSKSDVNEELQLEKEIMAKEKEYAKTFNEAEVWAWRGVTQQEKERIIKMHKQSLLSNERREKIVIPFYKKHLELKQTVKN